ncbi:MAG: Serine/threonine protein kinase, partial [Myxococcales bacterium]|nr:Serine/threonine protein kinase [Myxococcales bacterium]
MLMRGAKQPMSLVTRLGNYELIRLVARGGMADVYLARQRGVGQFERHVAVKVLNGAHSNDLEARALFLDEARLLAMLGHHNLASVFEVAIQDDVHYLAMEYVHGADLREVLNVAGKTGRAIPYEAATSIIASAAAGLDHAHRRCGPDGKPLHLVHRDVSLSNIMVGHDGNVKVVDFGIATATVSSVHTQPGVVRGKASYMSPEQCLGDDVDLRTDVFALGIVLYELTTGHRCFPGNNDFERMISVVRGDFVPPSVHIPSYPPALEAIVKIALSPVGSQAGLIGVLVAVAVVAAVNAGKNKATANRRFQLGRLEIVTRDRRNLAISARYKNVGE